jgi:predicted RNA-binding Zn-ribbon protein involved in translation (DUF1610 family)
MLCKPRPWKKSKAERGDKMFKEINPSLPLRVVPEPSNTNDVLVAKDAKKPIISGEGNMSFICGSCKNLLLRDVDFGKVSNKIFKCPKCGSFNSL